MNINRTDALKLLHEHVKSDSLRKHCLAVAYAMEAYAEKYNEDKDVWFITGLLHDFDYEKYPNLQQHPFEGVKILKFLGYQDEIIEAILGHAEYSGIERKTNLAKALFALDELSGLIVALAKVRPNNFAGMDSNSISKAMKKKGFAAAINRDDIEKGIKELNVDKDEHFNLVISALAKNKVELGF